jgi:hypothetical protein
VAAVGGDEQPGVGKLALQGPRLVDGDERVTVADDDQRRGVDPDQVGRLEEALLGDVPRDGRHQPAPGTGSLNGIVPPGQGRRPARVAVDEGRIHHPPRDGRPRFALGRDPDDDERLQALGATSRELERGRAAHREPEQWNVASPIASANASRSSTSQS